MGYVRKVWWCKLGTQPAVIQFKYYYRLRKNLKVVFRELKQGSGGMLPASNWQTGIVDLYEGYYQKLFISKM